jgi:DNA-directed RNA polymerase specialized sigma24 family protein
MDGRYQRRDPVAFIALVRNHHREIFHLVHALLRDEVAAEKITQQVFSRARRRLDRRPGASSVVEWIYYASFRFVRMYQWRSAGTMARRRITATLNASQPGLDLSMFVQVIVRHPGKIDPRDCELLALRHVLGMSLTSIAQLLRLHPYEVANRLAWAHERVCKLSHQPSSEAAKSAAFALSA